MKQKLLSVLPTRVYLPLKRWNYKHKRRMQFNRLQQLRSVITEYGYSFKPFDERKAIFVHVPKCAGVSVSKAIYGCLGGGHTTLDQYLNVFEPECIRSYFKFTVVRNPWSRLVSSYSFLSNGGFCRSDDQWFKRELGHFHDFDDFVKNWVNEHNIWKWVHFRPQYHYLLEKHGKVDLDFVGFLENISDDFSYIASRINVKSTLGISNAGDHRSYMDYYTGDTKKIVAEAYAKDIAMLGYTFDNSSLEEQVAWRDAGKAFPPGFRFLRG